jgi:hypothetical protein
MFDRCFFFFFFFFFFFLCFDLKRIFDMMTLEKYFQCSLDLKSIDCEVHTRNLYNKLLLRKHMHIFVSVKTNYYLLK